MRKGNRKIHLGGGGVGLLTVDSTVKAHVHSAHNVRPK